MKPGACDLEVYRGDTARWQFLLWADKEKTTPTDLTGATVDAEIRSTSGKPEGAITCTVTPPNTIEAVLEADAWPTPYAVMSLAGICRSSGRQVRSAPCSPARSLRSGT